MQCMPSSLHAVSRYLVVEAVGVELWLGVTTGGPGEDSSLCANPSPAPRDDPTRRTSAVDTRTILLPMGIPAFVLDLSRVFCGNSLVGRIGRDSVSATCHLPETIVPPLIKHATADARRKSVIQVTHGCDGHRGQSPPSPSAHLKIMRSLGRLRRYGRPKARH